MKTIKDDKDYNIESKLLDYTNTWTITEIIPKIEKE